MDPAADDEPPAAGGATLLACDAALGTVVEAALGVLHAATRGMSPIRPTAMIDRRLMRPVRDIDALLGMGRMVSRLLVPTADSTLAASGDEEATSR